MILSSLCYIYRGNEVLMLHRNKKLNDPNYDKWIGVGGKFEEDESPEECVLRETFEETGFTLTEYRFRGIVTFVSDRYETEYMHLFTATDFTGELIGSNEGCPEWIPTAKLPTLTQWEGDRIFLDLIEKDAPFFSLKLQYQGEKLTKAFLNGSAVQLPYSKVLS